MNRPKVPPSTLPDGTSPTPIRFLERVDVPRTAAPRPAEVVVDAPKARPVRPARAPRAPRPAALATSTRAAPSVPCPVCGRSGADTDVALGPINVRIHGFHIQKAIDVVDLIAFVNTRFLQKKR